MHEDKGIRKNSYLQQHKIKPQELHIFMAFLPAYTSQE